MNNGPFSMAASSGAQQRATSGNSGVRHKPKKTDTPKRVPTLEEWCDLLHLMVESLPINEARIKLQMFPSSSVMNTMISVAKHLDKVLDFTTERENGTILLFMTLKSKEARHDATLEEKPHV